jgi:hypothetical protein
MPAPRRPAAPRRTRRSIRPYFTDMPGCRADRNAAPPPAFQPASCAMPRSDMVVRSRRTRLDSITRTSVDASMRYAVCGMSYESADTDAEFERFVVRRRLFERAYERQRRVWFLLGSVSDGPVHHRAGARGRKGYHRTVRVLAWMRGDRTTLGSGDGGWVERSTTTTRSDALHRSDTCHVSPWEAPWEAPWEDRGTPARQRRDNDTDETLTILTILTTVGASLATRRAGDWRRCGPVMRCTSRRTRRS